MDRTRNPEPFEDDGAVFGLLTDDPRLHWATSELERELGWSKERVQDSLASLARDGLINRTGSVVFASRAAVRSRELLA
jgi:hypothetical protein